ncbi:MAG TPA: E2 ligase fold family C protein [Puia sp.]|nr:E2 ligase fold family C protein [Puia sp.]
MALANFFDKTALQASQVLADYNREQFEAILMSHRVLLSCDETCQDSPEADATLDLAVRLLARLYPYLIIEGPLAMKERLQHLAVQINPRIEVFDPSTATVAVVVGRTRLEGDFPVFYIGSDGWKARLSTSEPIGSLGSENPFGAGAAACWGAANVFRYVFRDHLPFGGCDSEISYSLLDGSSVGVEDNPGITDLEVPETILAGLGAIGNAITWALRRMRTISGRLVLVDHEDVDLTNLQRYVMAIQDNVGKKKVQVAGDYFADGQLRPQPEPYTLEEYMQYQGNWRVNQLMVAVDNAPDRILAQGVLPQVILNSWTQAENLGVSRHTDFISDPCVCCLYYPKGQTKSYSQEVADNLGIPDQERMVRTYLAGHLPVDQCFIQIIASANGIDSGRLLPYCGYQLPVFYSRVVCGGVLMSLQPALAGRREAAMHVPAAFESAMAGILLAAEWVKLAMGITASTNTTQFNLMRPFSYHVHLSVNKVAGCVCQDPVFRAVYSSKWRKGVTSENHH